MNFIDLALSRSRTVLLALALLLVSGTVTYIGIPKESNPDIDVPIIYVLMNHEGISPEDGERLLIRPMEQELRSIEGVKEMRSTAFVGGASVTLEFEAGFDSDQAALDVREKVDIAKAELPQETEEPKVYEVNVALFPILVTTLSGPVPERTLISLARALQDQLEALPGVLEAEIGGDREEMVEILVDPMLLQSYQLTEADLFRFVARNNKLVAAGAMDTGNGRFAIKVPGVFETVEDVLNLPVKAIGERLVRFRDVATVRRAFKDPKEFARVDGQPAVTLEIKKRVGANILDLVDQVRHLVEAQKTHWPDNVQVAYTYDESIDIKNMLSDLQNSVLIAVLLVAIVVVAALGPRTGTLVAIAIPGSFVIGILALSLMGLTVNMVVLFSLIMAVGMLVDGAIVVTEYADRKMAGGEPRSRAYAMAARRMAWPIIASTATTLAAFGPLLFWPGMVGEFMKYLPITLIATLSASLLMALVFVPTLGAWMGKPGAMDTVSRQNLANAERGDLSAISGFTRHYLRVLTWVVDHPLRVFLTAVMVLASIFAAYGKFGKGVEFFPDVETKQAVVQVRARGDLSIWERDELVRRVENRLLGIAEFDNVYTRVSSDESDDLIGTLQLNFLAWDERERSGSEVLEEVRERVAGLAGIVVEMRTLKDGPDGDQKPIQLAFSADNPSLARAVLEEVRSILLADGGYRDIEDTLPVPGIEWRVMVDRAKAARFGADVALVGSFVQMTTNGIKLGEYRPDDSDDELDIRVRFPAQDRNLTELSRLRVQADRGPVPAANFVSMEPAAKTANVERADGRRVYYLRANSGPRTGEDVVSESAMDAKRRAELRGALAAAALPGEVSIEFKGQDEDQRESQKFLANAFVVALFIMALILVTQFNSFYQSFLILTAVVFSTGGVLLGLLLMGQAFGILMSGIGVIALAGIVVNNNIVLIDTFNVQRRISSTFREAVLRTGVLRLRPVLLTTVTTILGLLPMVLKLNINLFTREISHGAPSTQWWVQLATAVAGGLAFATVLTLVLTPALLVLGDRVGRWILQWRHRHQAAEVVTVT